MKVVFVCTGNTCRSPMAEGFLKKISSDVSDNTLEVCSRGIAASQGCPASENANLAAAELGADISGHCAVQLTADDVADADIVFTVTTAHADLLCSEFPGFSGKIFSISSYAGTNDIADPFGGDIDVYRNCSRQIYDACKKIYEKLTVVKNEHNI